MKPDLEPAVTFSDHGDRWVSVHDKAGREHSLPRKKLVQDEARFEFLNPTDVYGLGFWTAASGGKCDAYEEVSSPGIEGLTVRVHLLDEPGPDLEPAEEMLLTHYNLARNTHPLVDPLKLQPGKYKTRIPLVLAPGQPLIGQVAGDTVVFAPGLDADYFLHQTTNPRSGNTQIFELTFRASSGHEVTVQTGFSEQAAIREGQAYRLLDVHRLGPRLIRT